MPTTTAPAAPLIDWATIATIFQWSLLVVLAASILYIAAARSAAMMVHKGGLRVVGVVGILLSGGISATIVVWGLYLITAKG